MGVGKAWGPSQLDSPLILSKEASPQGRGRLSPDIKGPEPLALSWEPCKVIGNMRMTLCPSPKARLGKMKRRISWQPSARALAELESLTAASACPLPTRLLAATLEDGGPMHGCGTGASPHSKGTCAWGAPSSHGPGGTRAGSSQTLKVNPHVKILELPQTSGLGGSSDTFLSPPLPSASGAVDRTFRPVTPLLKTFPGGNLVTSSECWVHVPFDPAVPLLGYLSDICTSPCAQKWMNKDIFIAGLFMEAKV